MRRITQKRRTPPGASPGTLVTDPLAVGPTVCLIGYGPDDLEEREVSEIEDLKPLIGRWPVTWINVDGLADLELIRRLGEMFELHRLALEDVVNVHQRPKVEEYEDHAFVVTRMIHGDQEPMTEQVSIFLGERFLLTFQERPGDCFDLVRERIRKHRGLIRERGADYLAYALLDAVIDGYFPVLEDYGERLEALEDAVMGQPSRDHVAQIHDMKRDLLTLRRAIWPQREMINALTRDSSPQVSEQTRVYLRDCYDHTVQLMDVVETYREIASGLVDVYLSSTSAHMNEIMKVLTIIATIFMPLGFIAGLYGMNFDRGASPWNMPELGWYLGYPFALLLMAVVAVGLLLYFRRKGWMGSGQEGRRRIRPFRQ
ncbi:MAG: magnesium/cobalt transporter CorA [Rhodospirillales bacterium]|nr:magnesium/cobalt transporter CorA [Rhodospirillales bacterium]